MPQSRPRHRRRVRCALVGALAGALLTTGSACSFAGAPGAAQAGECSAEALAPAAVQGTGLDSAQVREEVTIEGVVIGDFQGDEEAVGDLDGFFLQGAADGDLASSDAVFVYAPNSASVATGDRVQVSGTVEEHFTQTQVATVTSLQICGSDALPDPVPLALPLTGPVSFEALEGMRVRLGDLTVAETRLLDDFGEVVLSAGGPLPEPTEATDPGQDARAVAAANLAQQIVLDDGRSGTQQRPVRYLDPGQTLRVSAGLAKLTGVLSFAFERWRVQPTEPVTFAAANARPESAPYVGGDLRIASFNVLNYFTSLVGGRGASTAEDFAEQQAKIVAAISGLNADIVALAEIESNDGVATQALVDALNEAAGQQRWAPVPVPTTFTGTDEITVAQIFQPDAVQRVGEPVALTDPAFANARQPIAQTYTRRGETLTVIANHFKSKSCGQALGDNADQGDGAGCWNADRTRQARALAAFVDDRITATGDDDVLVVGDLNSYTREEPVDILVLAGLVNQLTRYVPDPQRYSYVFDGSRGVLDHALATPELSAKITGAALWHINADEPDLLEYPGDPAYTALDAYRASDHDPVIVGVGD